MTATLRAGFIALCIALATGPTIAADTTHDMDSMPMNMPMDKPGPPAPVPEPGLPNCRSAATDARIKSLSVETAALSAGIVALKKTMRDLMTRRMAIAASHAASTDPDEKMALKAQLTVADANLVVQNSTVAGDEATLFSRTSTLHYLQALKAC